jgi:hypothetical protein
MPTPTTSDLRRLKETDFAVTGIVSETRRLIIGHRLICAVMRRLLGSTNSVYLVKCCRRVSGYEVAQNRSGVGFRQSQSRSGAILLASRPSCSRALPQKPTARLGTNTPQSLQPQDSSVSSHHFKITLPSNSGSSKWSLCFRFHYQKSLKAFP